MNLNLDGTLCGVCCNMECRHRILELEPMGDKGFEVDETTCHEPNRLRILGEVL